MDLAEVHQGGVQIQKDKAGPEQLENTSHLPFTKKFLEHSVLYSCGTRRYY